MIIFTFVATATPECLNHDKMYAYRERYSVKYLDSTDLGLAAHYNFVDSVDDLILEVWLPPILYLYVPTL